jgi:uncharacterized membrane protein (UPF0127 family)
MQMRFTFGRALLLAAGSFLAFEAQAPVPAATPTATSSADCPSPATDTQRFLRATALAVRAPKGELALVPVTTEAARERGLMCVVRIPHSRGMIFAFQPPDRVQGFWMKNTLVALDMVFVTAAGTITTVAADVPPTARGTPDDAVARRQGMGQYVIELGAGDAARHRLVTGTKLYLPALTARE